MVFNNNISTYIRSLLCLRIYKIKTRMTTTIKTMLKKPDKLTNIEKYTGWFKKVGLVF